MNKAKAAFAGIMIVLVAGASAAMWYFGGGRETDEKTTSAVYEEQAGGEKDRAEAEKDGAETPQNRDEEKKTENTASSQTAPSSETAANGKNEPENGTPKLETKKINEFLSVFSNVYFAENTGGYSANSGSAYELIRFAYSHIKETAPSKIVTKESGDKFGMYSGASYGDVNGVLAEYLGVSVGKESVYTEKEYAFFKYEDGYFYAPAADGVGFGNTAVADSAEKNGDEISVSFTVYSSGVNSSMTSAEAMKKGEKYSSGTAVIREKNGNYILVSYKVNV